MRRLNLLLLLLVVTFLPLSAKFVDVKTANTVAKNWYALKSPQKNNDILTTRTLNYNSKPSIYMVDFKHDGFVLVAADDLVNPVLAYSTQHNVPQKIDRDNYKYFLNYYHKQIERSRKNNIINPEISYKWQKIIAGQSYLTRTDDFVRPLLFTQWNQGFPYNENCPEDAAGPGGHVYAGCVATAMGQVMRYWGTPLQGNGSHGYTPQGYSYQFADFANTSYDMWEMPWSISRSTPEVAKFLHHCGISVEMIYGSAGSGAYSNDVPNAMISYFGYASSTNFKRRHRYSDSQWLNMIKAELDQGRPLYYSGSSDEGGHAFVLDGYRDDDFAHFDFGWSGHGNGYYSLGAISGSGGDGYNYGQGAVFEAIPNNYTPNSGVLVFNPDLNNPNSSGFAIKTWLHNNGNSTIKYTNKLPFNLRGFSSVFITIPNVAPGSDNYFELNKAQSLVINKYLEAGGNLYIEGSSIFSNSTLNKAAFGIQQISDGQVHTANTIKSNSFSIANGFDNVSLTASPNNIVNILTPSNIGTSIFTEENYGTVAVQSMGHNNQKTICNMYNLSNMVAANNPEFLNIFLTRTVMFFQGNNKPESNFTFELDTSTNGVLNINLDYEGSTNLTAWRLYIDDEQHSDITAIGDANAELNNIPAGYHIIQVSAGNMYGETEKSAKKSFFINDGNYTILANCDDTSELPFTTTNGTYSIVKFTVPENTLLTDLKLNIAEIGRTQTLIRVFENTNNNVGETITQKVFIPVERKTGWHYVSISQQGIALPSTSFYVSILNLRGSDKIGVDTSTSGNSFTKTLTDTDITSYNEGEFMIKAITKPNTSVSAENNVNMLKPSISNYPNPFNPTTNLRFTIAKNTNVKIDIYNVRGQKVKRLTNKHYNSGTHVLKFDGKGDNGNSLSSGIYFYKMKTARYTSTKKMILLK